MRDVSELRRREQELLTKDATIREIHHRVKNNLQTVAALLRLQARRVTDDAARASLEEAVRRVDMVMASRTPAAFLGLESELGRIAPGYRADLVAFNPNFEVVGTWIGGVGSIGEASEAFHRG